MREFSYKINLGIIGLNNECNQILVDHFSKESGNSQHNSSRTERFIIYDEIPIKIKYFIAESFNDLIKNHTEIKRVDVLFCVLNMYEVNSINNFNNVEYSNFGNIFKFDGISALIGVDLDQIEQKNIRPENKINEFTLIQKTQELDFIYCFKIQDIKKNLNMLYDNIFKHIILKFKILDPDRYQKARDSQKK